MRPTPVRSLLRLLGPLLLVAGLVMAAWVPSGVVSIPEAAAAPDTTIPTLQAPDQAAGEFPLGPSMLMQVATPTATPTPAVTPAPDRTPAPTPAATPTPRQRELPNSGSFTAVLALSAVTAIQVGAGLMLFASRRRRPDAEPELGDEFFFRP